MNFSYCNYQLPYTNSIPCENYIPPTGMNSLNQLNYQAYNSLKYEYQSRLWNLSQPYTTSLSSLYSLTNPHLQPPKPIDNIKIEEKQIILKQQVLQKKKFKPNHKLVYYDPSTAPLFISTQQENNENQNKLSDQNYQSLSNNRQQNINKQIKIQQKQLGFPINQQNQNQSPFIIIKKKNKKQRTRRFQLVLLRRIKKNMVVIKERAKKLLQGQEVPFNCNDTPVQNHLTNNAGEKQLTPTLAKSTNYAQKQVKKQVKIEENQANTSKNLQFSWKEKTDYFNAYFTMHLDDLLKRKMQ